MKIKTPVKTDFKGFTLIEVMVSMLLVAIGLLGMMSFQLQGLRNNLHTEAFTQAVVLAQDMAERMRSNRGGWEDGSYDNISANESSSGCFSGCEFKQIADTDAVEWAQHIADVLPGKGNASIDSDSAFGSVTKNTTASLQYWNIEVTWYEKSTVDGQHQAKSYVLTVTR